MVQINEQQAKEFLDNIKKEDKVIIIHDNDPDGFSSGLLFYNFCKQKTSEKNITTRTFSREKSNLSTIDLKNKTKVIITDLSPNFLEKGIENLKGKEVLYLDHHPKNAELPNEIFELRTPSRIHCARVTYNILKNNITKEKEWILLVALFADIGYIHEDNLKEAKQYLKKYNLTMEQAKEIEYEVGDLITYFHDTPDKAFKILQEKNSIKELEEIREYSEEIQKETTKHIKDYQTKKEKIGKANYFYFKTKFFIKSKVTTIISKENPDETYIFASPIGNDKMSISARNQSQNPDVSKLLQECTKNFENATAGGHAFSSGATIQAKDLEKFKENLRNYVG